MDNKRYALVTSVGGHAFMELGFAAAYNQQPVVFSEKDNKEDFEKEVAEIYERFSPMFPDIKVATWDERENFAKQGVSWRRELLDGKIDATMWDEFAQSKLKPQVYGGLPKFAEIKGNFRNILLIPQKLISDGKCGITAQQQTVPLSAFNFFKNEDGNRYILGQHFHKINDVENVNEIAAEFGMYVPGAKEDKHVYGIRGVSHEQYLNMYKKLDMSVGIAGTHTWYMLTCFPNTPQIILYNKNGVENWENIAEAYRKNGKKVYALGFDENTNWKKFALEIKQCYVKLADTVDKQKAKKVKSLPKKVKEL